MLGLLFSDQVISLCHVPSKIIIIINIVNSSITITRATHRKGYFLFADHYSEWFFCMTFSELS